MENEIIEIPNLPEEIVKEIRKLKYDPKAKGYYEWLSGGLIWEDEFTDELLDRLLQQGNPIIQYLFRYLWAYRRSLICGKERAEFRNIWQTVYQQVPFWPGFRPERLDSTYLQMLLDGEKQMQQELDSLDCLDDSE